jgi:uncharacterized protein
MRRALAAILTVPLLAACSEGDDDPAPDSAPPPSSTQVTTAPPEPSESSEPTDEPTDEPTAEPSPEPTDDPAADLPPVTNRLSLPAIMREDLNGHRLRVIRQVPADTGGHTKYEVSYRSDGLTITGELFRPNGRGPFPALVLNHGYIDPAYYETGQGLAREQTWLADAGFVVLHTDYRGHAGSDDVPPVDMESRLGYARDAANAVRALKQLDYVDADKLGMLGRSMGGGVTQNVLVAYPGLVDAAVIYASVSSDFVDNLEQFTEPNRPDELQAYYERFGTPRENPDFYAGLSSRTYYDRITEPVLSLHGEVDDTCPPRWARASDRLMKRAGVDSELVFYEGEGHTFYGAWERSIRRSVRFFKRQLDVPA